MCNEDERTATQPLSSAFNPREAPPFYLIESREPFGAELCGAEEVQARQIPALLCSGIVTLLLHLGTPELSAVWERICFFEADFSLPCH